MNYELLTKQKETLDSFRPFPSEVVRNLESWFSVELTFTSNALEGNTLTRQETAVVIEKGLTVRGKSLREHIEATNHAAALELVRGLSKKKPSQMQESDILAIHQLILRGIDDENAGLYRRVPVRISGSAVVMPNPRKVPALMEEFVRWLTTKSSLHPVAFAGEAHYHLVTVHPFVDGNGRTARLLMNLLLLASGYPPAIIRNQDRLAYIEALEKAQLGGSRKDFDTLIFHAARRSLGIYLKALTRISSSEPIRDSAALLKIGALAKATNTTVPTIRFWTQQGLLEVEDSTPGGYALYAPEMIERCAQIKNLKQQRLSLEEIGEILLQDKKKK